MNFFRYQNRTKGVRVVHNVSLQFYMVTKVKDLREHDMNAQHRVDRVVPNVV